jgi:hypothetical protein
LSGELIRRPTGQPLSRPTRRAISGIVAETYIEQAQMRAISVVAEAGMTEVVFLKRTQRELEMLAPDASEALNLIATTAAMAIARTVARYGNQA